MPTANESELSAQYGVESCWAEMFGDGVEMFVEGLGIYHCFG